MSLAAETERDLRRNLAQFTGTTCWYQLSPLYRHVGTDGVVFLAEEANCFWLIDMIASHLITMDALIYESQAFFSKLPTGSGGRFTLAGYKNDSTDALDDNPIGLASQNVSFTDFPLDEIEIRVSAYDHENERYVFFLPSER